MIPLLLACAAPEEVDTGPPPFRVVGSAPADGADDVVEAVTPELRLSAAVDVESCGADGARLDAVDDAGAVYFPVPVTYATAEAGEKLQLVHAGPLPRGFTYALTVRTGEGGCHSEAGVPIDPFRATFFVP